MFDPDAACAISGCIPSITKNPQSGQSGPRHRGAARNQTQRFKSLSLYNYNGLFNPFCLFEPKFCVGVKGFIPKLIGVETHI